MIHQSAAESLLCVRQSSHQERCQVKYGKPRLSSKDDFVKGWHEYERE